MYSRGGDTTFRRRGKVPFIQPEKTKPRKNKGNGKIQPKRYIKKESKGFFCKKKGHVKKDYLVFKT